MSGEAKINCLCLESFLPLVFKIDLGGFGVADLGFGVSTLLIGRFFSFLCLERYWDHKNESSSSSNLKIFSMTVSALELLEVMDVVDICRL